MPGDPSQQPVYSQGPKPTPTAPMYFTVPHDLPPAYDEIRPSQPCYGATQPPSTPYYPSNAMHACAAPERVPIPLSSLRIEGDTVQCPNCHYIVETIPKHKPGTASVISALALLIFGFNAGCCLIPFCLPPCLDIHHQCPQCHHTIAVYSRLEQTARVEA